MKKEKGLEIIKERVEDFEKNKALIMKKGYGETNIRSNYIDIMFEALGWDIRNKHEVDREFSQKDKSKEANTKKVDYAFKINGKLKFFIEAKEASVDLENNKDAIYQAKRYAYSSNGKAPIVILTDFEEFRVFNVLTAPLYENPDKQLLKTHSFQYTDYLEKWELLWNTFSREAVENGSLDELRGVITKNTKTMDKDFLEQITSWRELLAKNVAIRNENLNVDEINEAVQRILDRLIFIRNLEDREIEPENTLLNIAKNKTDILKSLVPLFSNLNTTYNGLLFKKHFSEDINVDDKTIHDIIRQMNYPVSPFQFDVIEPEILGRIYEKFLGSKIRLTDSHRAKVEEKIEVRKAGGVYYTPEYIVEYIVQNTVGKKIEGLTPDEIKEIKIVDPACGSGSFLIGAYAYLIDYHQKWYTSNKANKNYKADWYKSKDGEIKVTLDKRDDILRNNIFGVDIDKEATEVAIMSLYLKMLDDGFDKGERDLFFVKGSVLPDMVDNVKCGNSLIGSNYFDGKLNMDIQEKEIKPFDWNREFSEIFKNNGFDCVIGNPPYGALYDDSQKQYIKTYYKTPEGRYDNFELFIEKGINLLNNKGLLGYIIPSPFLTNLYSRKLREYILNNHSLLEIVSFSMQVFEDPTVHTCIIRISPVNNPDNKIILKNNINSILKLSEKSYFTVSQSNFKDNDNFVIDVFIDPSTKIIIDKLKLVSYQLGDICYIRQCIKTGDDKKYVKLSDLSLEEPWKKSLKGKSISRYQTLDKNIYLKYGNWLARNWKNKTFYETNKIAIRETGSRITATIDLENRYFLSSLYAIYYKNINLNTENNLKYLLAIINSQVANYFVKIIALNLTEGAFTKVRTNQLARLPIPNIDENNMEIKEDLSVLVDQMLETNEEYFKIQSESDKLIFQQKIELIDSKIDNLIFSLYNLDENDIEIIKSFQ